MIFKVRRFVLSGCLLLVGCSAFGPDRDYMAAAHSEQQQVQQWKALAEARPATSLTDLMAVPKLHDLVMDGLRASPDLQQTLLTLRIRRQQLRETNAARLPTLDAGLQGNKQEESDPTYTGDVTISWELDLWNRLGNLTSAASKDVAQQLATYQSARDTLAAQIMQAWLALIADQHVIDIQQRRLHTLQQNEQFITDRYRNGIGTLDDLDTARTSTAAARATLAEYQEDLLEQQRQLNQLLGRHNKQLLSAANDYPKVLIPLSQFPQQTLARRPDLKAAYLAIEAADLRTRAAYKELLPSFNLQAGLTQTATTPRDALLTDPLWTLLGNLTAPLFQGGQLRAAAKEAELNTALAYQSYRQTLLTAVNEVDNALSTARTLQQRQHHIEQALASSRNSLQQYQQSYRNGLTDILELLSVQQNTFDLEAQLDNLIYQRLANRVQLGLALGLGVQE